MSTLPVTALRLTAMKIARGGGTRESESQRMRCELLNHTFVEALSDYTH